MQARLTNVLGLHSTGSRISVTSIASFAENINTKEAYKQFYRNLHQIGVTEDMIRQNEKYLDLRAWLSVVKSAIVILGIKVSYQEQIVQVQKHFTYVRQALTYNR